MPGKKAKKEQPAKEGAGKEGGEGGEGKPYPGADSIIHELELQRLTEKVEGLCVPAAARGGGNPALASHWAGGERAKGPACCVWPQRGGSRC